MICFVPRFERDDDRQTTHKFLLFDQGFGLYDLDRATFERFLENWSLSVSVPSFLLPLSRHLVAGTLKNLESFVILLKADAKPEATVRTNS